jgi:hypothetical protein
MRDALKEPGASIHRIRDELCSHSIAAIEPHSMAAD